MPRTAKTNTDPLAWLKGSAFRTVGLAGDASWNAIQESARGMRIASRLGRAKTTGWDLPWVSEVIRTEGAIRDALGRLSNPTQRVYERLFWFHNSSAVDWLGGLSLDSLADGVDSWAGMPDAAHQHDAALLGLLAAALLDPEGANESRWLHVFEMWTQLKESETYWALLRRTESEAEFEPAATVREIDALRQATLNHVAGVVSRLASEALGANDHAACERLLRLLRKALPPEIISAQEDQVLGGLETALEGLCADVKEACGKAIKRSEESVAANRLVCAAAVKRFDHDVEEGLKGILAASGADSSPARRARETAAACLLSIAINYTWANEFALAQGLLERAEKLAPASSPVSLHIKESLSAVQRSARGAGVYKNLQPVKDAPPLWSFNGFGLGICGSSDVDPDTGSYLTTYYLTALFIPLFPICRYRVIALEEGKYLFFGRAPLRIFDRWHLGLALAGLLAVLIALSVSSNSPPSSEPQRANQETLSVLQSQIESGRVRIGSLKAEISAADAELADLKDQLDNYEAMIRPYEQQAQLGVLVDTYGYSQAVDDYNALLPRYNALLSRYKELYGEYDSLVEEDNRLLDQYNALLGE